MRFPTLKEGLIGFGLSASWAVASYFISPAATLSIPYFATTTLIAGGLLTGAYLAGKGIAKSYGFLKDEFEDKHRSDFNGEHELSLEPSVNSPEYFENLGGYSRRKDNLDREYAKLCADQTNTTFTSETASNLAAKAVSYLPSCVSSRIPSWMQGMIRTAQPVEYTITPHQEPENVYEVGGHRLRQRHNQAS